MNKALWSVVFVSLTCVSNSFAYTADIDDPIAKVTVTDITDSVDLINDESIVPPCIIDCAGKPNPVLTPGVTPSPSPSTGVPTTGTPSPGIPTTGVPPTPTPTVNTNPGNTTTTGTTGSHMPPGPPLDLSQIVPGTGGVILNQLLLLGNKIWDFVIQGKPVITSNTVSAQVLPSGISSYTQLAGWKRKGKVYKVQFTSVFGLDAGYFEYRVNYIYGGHYKGKGQFIAQLTFALGPSHLHTDRNLTIHAEVLNPANMGTEDDPIAGVDLLISYSTPTTLTADASSFDYFIQGDGQLFDQSNGVSSLK